MKTIKSIIVKAFMLSVSIISLVMLYTISPMMYLVLVGGIALFILSPIVFHFYTGKNLSDELRRKVRSWVLSVDFFSPDVQKKYFKTEK